MRRREVLAITAAAGGLVAAGALTVALGRARRHGATALMLAHTDDLTGLANRRGWRQSVRSRPAGRSCVVLVVDVDRFKNVNDTYGHPAGNGVLVEVAVRLAAACGPDALLARYGGDEFTVLVPVAVPAPSVAARIAQRVAAAVVIPAGVCVPVTVTCSVGAALLIPGGDPHVALARADQAMYAAKNRRPATPRQLQVA